MNRPIPLARGASARGALARGALALSLSLVFPAAALASPGAHGPNGEHLDAPGATVNASGLARLPDGSVNVPVAAQRRMEIRTRFAEESEAAVTVELSGRVVMDPNAGGRVQPMYAGRIEPGPKGLPLAGQGVRAGEVLAWLRYQPEPFALAEQQALLVEVRNNRALAEQRLSRLQGLAGTVPRKEIDAARAELESLQARERRMGGALQGREALKAPMDGVIARAEVVAGQVVEARDILYEVVDPARVLIEATVADPALAAKVESARVVEAPAVALQLVGSARSLRDGVLPLTFRGVAKEEGANTPGAGKAAPALPLAVGQPVTVVAALAERTRGFVLPAEAVVRNPANEPIVWIKSGAERYIPQPVQYRPLDASRVVITHGLGADNRVVVQGAPLIAQIR
ncbi:HlyD family efflux transporter periplasmic adaptor subunit [Azoarcus indigens]|uniref:Multidrug efflux pump subunit AcrA (Membrane-fusion protein) n=1 Tax=Azoarcus indigens TaxID=29545 RepID=A0A4R6DRL8_9RHOO|nr:efflux RND transporter periplasmic adaptor subunit [Azoarcus indigens]NMG67304.1 HlyD family efflux transporter periplasmic adaptor subunit [Azoarcus indigens]TDN46938.1 multidrug efflux pump subunit AcrA (membrane-fusion protein) [Azoarcus indigens]